MPSGVDQFPVDHMGTKQVVELKAALAKRAKYIVGVPVYWRGTMYRISGRYHRRSMDTIVYDLREIMADGGYGRFQKKRRELELEDVPEREDGKPP